MDVKILEKNKIDVKHGLELLGDMDFYNETLETFYNGIDKNLKDLKKFKDKDDFENYDSFIEEINRIVKVVKEYLGR